MAIYIGGDTETLEYSTLFKEANEPHPVKIWRSCAKELIPPSKTGKPNDGWDDYYDKDQGVIDKISKLDNDYYEYNSSSHDGVRESGRYAQIMLEVDLTQYCQDRFNGNNNLLRENFKSATITTYAMGSGVVDAVKYGCEVYVYGWDKWNGDNKNHTNEIKEITFGVDRFQYIQTNNKIYILIKSLHPSDTNITSTLSLDYFNIKLEFKRDPDKVESIDIELTDKWAIQGEFYPSFESGQTSDKVRGIFDIRNTNNVNRFYFELSRDGTKLTLAAMLNYKGIGNAVFDVNFKKWQNIRFVLQRNKKEFTVCILINGELKTQKFTTKDDAITGNLKFDIGSVLGGTFYSNSFIDNFKLYSNQTFSESEMEEILRESKNLIPKFNEKDENGKPLWSINPNTTVSEDGNSIVVNTTIPWANNYIMLPIFPNNKYKLTSVKSENAYFDVDFYYNNIIALDNSSKNENIIEFITPRNCNLVRINCGNREQGTFTFSDLELKLVQ
ncbi:hypothetical protein HAHI6034_04950 [Hathewaya histolytica]|uniref:Uncharacterized protein n=1 Tax=Hathewaya histolytica TaxID=1498 RepID=A0A4U9R6D6_HATHI|nr:hypothetical protein [Hathewaya histolytica]VTQ87054.1 Uncharacterised protein [Hathewaya histolytica]